MARPKLQTVKGKVVAAWRVKPAALKTRHAGVNPPNPSDVLQPAPIMTRTVAQVLNTRALGYVYA